MNESTDTWTAAIRERFSDREDVGKAQAYERFFARSNLSKQAVYEVLELLESEYGVPAGVLRPSDRLDKLMMPVRPANFWQWAVYQVKQGDRHFALQEALTKRLKHFGTVEVWRDVSTLAEYISAWDGRAP